MRRRPDGGRWREGVVAPPAAALFAARGEARSAQVLDALAEVLRLDAASRP
ncbi:hypothetical protein [Actinoallomurus liliacearum]|uniref:hypothetical protein n=1 Tax=Actinoallomurus liliacearum TaxID=1080073 RepID=UPI0031E7518C